MKAANATGCPNKNEAVACCFSSATALLFWDTLYKPIAPTTHIFFKAGEMMFFTLFDISNQMKDFDMTCCNVVC